MIELQADWVHTHYYAAGGELEERTYVAEGEAVKIVFQTTGNAPVIEDKMERILSPVMATLIEHRERYILSPSNPLMWDIDMIYQRHRNTITQFLSAIRKGEIKLYEMTDKHILFILDNEKKIFTIVAPSYKSIDIFGHNPFTEGGI